MEEAEASLVVMAPAGFTGTRPCRLTALGIANGRILWVAPQAALGTASAPVAAHAAIHSFEHGFLMPGFHDAHIHCFHTALYGSSLATTFVGANEADCVACMQAFAATRPRGGWLLAQGWREYLWDPPRLPHRSSLDEAFPDQPVALYSGDAHTLWLNSCALDRLGITRTSTPPHGGSYDRDGEGELTGIVREMAAMELMPRIVEAFSLPELLCAYDAMQKRLNSQGITAVCDMALSATTGLDFVRDDLFSNLEASGSLTLRAHLFPTLTPTSNRLDGLRATLQGPLVRACGYKQFFDGVSSQHTAWLAKPYANARFEGDRGRPTLEPTDMAALVSNALKTGERVRLHTIGDQAIHEALDIRESIPDCGELVLEHLENFQPNDIPRLARLGVVASVQPQHITLDPGGPERDLGHDRTPWMWPFRQLLDAGATLAFGTDAPVTDTSPLAGLYTALTRKDAATREPEGGWHPEERITVLEALRAYTTGSAHACGRAGELGLLAPGMLADIAVFDRDLCHASPEELLDARTLAVYVGGQRVFEQQP